MGNSKTVGDTGRTEEKYYVRRDNRETAGIYQQKPHSLSGGRRDKKTFSGGGLYRTERGGKLEPGKRRKIFCHEKSFRHHWIFHSCQ